MGQSVPQTCSGQGIHASAGVWAGLKQPESELPLWYGWGKWEWEGERVEVEMMADGMSPHLVSGGLILERHGGISYLDD